MRGGYFVITSAKAGFKGQQGAFIRNLDRVDAVEFVLVSLWNGLAYALEYTQFLLGSSSLGAVREPGLLS